jgi:predicted amidohydrolase YtcJ
MNRVQVHKNSGVTLPPTRPPVPGYADGRGGLFMTAPDQMGETMRPWREAGFQINLHTNGNGGSQATIDALDGLMALKPRTDYRFAPHHYGISTPEMARRVARLAVTGCDSSSFGPASIFAQAKFLMLLSRISRPDCERWIGKHVHKKPGS